MQFKTLTLALALGLLSSEVAAAAASESDPAAAAASGAAASGAQLTLNAANVQSASDTTGAGATGATAAQKNSVTSNNNFINICDGKVTTNGKQFAGGSCNGIPMGDIPPQTQTPSTLITSPANGQDLPAEQSFNLVANIANIQTGTFTNPDVTYYSAPQALNAQQQIIGHTHFTIQNTAATLGAGKPLDPTKFAFFKGVDDAADGQGNVVVQVAGGLPAGSYRVCTMAAAANHQPVLVALAQ